MYLLGAFLLIGLIAVLYSSTGEIPISRRPHNRPVKHPLPGAEVTAGFGMIHHPTPADDGTFSVRRRYHNGIDLAPRDSLEVRTPDRGRVVRVSEDSRSGKWLHIDHPGDWQTAYCHLRRIDVAAGDSLHAGQVIGLAGETGKAQGVHLHFIVRDTAGERRETDPAVWLARGGVYV